MLTTEEILSELRGLVAKVDRAQMTPIQVALTLGQFAAAFEGLDERLMAGDVLPVDWRKAHPPARN